MAEQNTGPDMTEDQQTNEDGSSDITMAEQNTGPDMTEDQQPNEDGSSDITMAEQNTGPEDETNVIGSSDIESMRYLQAAFCDTTYRGGLYFIMGGGNLIAEMIFCFKPLVCLLNNLFPVSGEDDHHPFDILSNVDYYCVAENHRSYRIPNQRVMDCFVRVLTRHYQQQYGISELTIKDCSDSFVQLFTFLDEDADELAIPINNIYTNIKKLFLESVIEKFDHRDAHHILFLPLLLTGFKCTVPIKYLDAVLCKGKWGVLIKLGFEEEDEEQLPFDFYRRFRDNFKRYSCYQTSLPDSVEGFFIFSLTYTPVKSITITYSHERFNDKCVKWYSHRE